MAKYRPVKTCFWSDEWIATLTPQAKLLYLYLITNERTSLCGIYRLPIRYILFETGLNQKGLDDAFKLFGDRVKYFNGWVILKNYKKHQTASPKIKEGIKREELEIPQDIKDMAYPIDTLSIHTDKPILKLEPKLKPKLELEREEGAPPQKKEIRFEDPLWKSFQDLCLKRNIDVKISPIKYLELRDEYKTKISWWVEIQACIAWCYDNGKKQININRLRRWAQNTIKFNKEKEIKILQENQDKKNQLAPPKIIKRIDKTWEPPL